MALVIVGDATDQYHLAALAGSDSRLLGSRFAGCRRRPAGALGRLEAPKSAAREVPPLVAGPPAVGWTHRRIGGLLGSPDRSDPVSFRSAATGLRARDEALSGREHYFRRRWCQREQAAINHTRSPRKRLESAPATQRRTGPRIRQQSQWAATSERSHTHSPSGRPTSGRLQRLQTDQSAFLKLSKEQARPN